MSEVLVEPTKGFGRLNIMHLLTMYRIVSLQRSGGTVAWGRDDQNSRSYSHMQDHLTIPILLRWIVHHIHHNSVAVDYAVKSLLAAHFEGLSRKAAVDDYCENSGVTEQELEVMVEASLTASLVEADYGEGDQQEVC